ncbi:Os03g0196450, partial [Oryza sativa Japonica Group]
RARPCRRARSGRRLPNPGVHGAARGQFLLPSPFLFARGARQSDGLVVVVRWTPPRRKPKPEAWRGVDYPGAPGRRGRRHPLPAHVPRPVPPLGHLLCVAAPLLGGHAPPSPPQPAASAAPPPVLLPHRAAPIAWWSLPPIPCSPQHYGLANFAAVAVGSQIYVLGRSRFDARSYPLDNPSPTV